MPSISVPGLVLMRLFTSSATPQLWGLVCRLDFPGVPDRSVIMCSAIINRLNSSTGTLLQSKDCKYVDGTAEFHEGTRRRGLLYDDRTGSISPQFTLNKPATLATSAFASNIVTAVNSDPAAFNVSTPNRAGWGTVVRILNLSAAAGRLWREARAKPWFA